MQKALKNKFGELYLETSYDKDTRWVYNNWIGYVTVEDVKNGADASLDLLRAKGTHKLLNDNTHLTGPWDEANEWIATDWTPRALGAGLKRFAHVVSPDIFGALSAEAMQTRVSEFDFEMRIFQTKADAERWLHVN